MDIGSDHGGLLVWLLKSGRIERGIAVENKRRPFENSSSALRDLEAEVRLGDGLSVIRTGEANSLSICGMGAKRIVEILDKFPERVPDCVVLQAAQQPEVVREWGLKNGFHLTDECAVSGHWPNTTLVFQKAGMTGDGQGDPAYSGVDRESALLFGPHILKRGGAELEALLMEEAAYWSGFARLEPRRVKRLALVRNLLEL